uniref:Copper resistance protein D domain-containing protein n=1 Tax=Magnetococcus massalia (strain MO-1) TaxID=451514 RepID=A0A1S7LGV6_MAGMO|nr:Conserved membrane protein of unknown function [Candidatus Magnetococcus massalia]
MDCAAIGTFGNPIWSKEENMSVAVTLHLLAMVIWVGGMFFAHNFLRPASQQLPLEQRITLWAGVFRRFFALVWISAITLPVTGYWIIFSQMGGMAGVGLYIHLMQGLGLLMIALYTYMYFGPYRAFKRMADELLFPEAGMYMLKIRTIVTINLVLGLTTVIVGSAGRYI